MPLSTKYRVPAITRRSFVTAAAALATMPFASKVHAQSLNPWDYIVAMEATPTLGHPISLPVTERFEINGTAWDVYLQMPVKEGQDFHFTCEFDSAWIILRAYGFDVPLSKQLEIVGVDDSIEPYWVETDLGFDIYGGDVQNYFCGHINENLVARARCNAMRKVFEASGLGVSVTPDRPTIEAALRRGEPIFFKSTVDMLPWRPAFWHTPGGDVYDVVFSNDHALVVMGFNDTDVIIRDPLGPTSTNWERPWQWSTSWTRFVEVLASQGNDAIAIGPTNQPRATPAG